MARVKGGVHARKHHRTILKRAKGFKGARSRRYRVANETVLHADRYATRDRKTRKRNFRRLWITRINAACRMRGMSYSRFMHGLKVAGITIDRKILADLAVYHEDVFTHLVDKAKATQN